MAQQLQKKFIGNDQIDGSKIKLEQGESLRIVDSNNQEVDLVKLGESNEVLVKGEQVSLKSDLDSEISRAEGEEARIEAKLDQEISDREADVQDLQSQIDSLSGNSDSNFSQLQGELNQEISDRQSADSSLDSKITVEKERIDAILLASEADKNSFAEIVQLINSVDTENDSAFASYVLSNNESVSTLESELSDLDGYAQDIRSDLDQEVVDRSAADTALSGRISVLEQDPTTKSYVDSQISQQSSQSSTDISNEESRAMAAESQLSTAISNEQIRAMAAESQLSTDISNEESRAMAAESELSTAISTEQSRAMAAESELSTAISTEQSRAEDEEARIEAKLDQEISDRQSAMSTEQSRAEDEEARIEAKLDQEISDRQSAVSTEQSRAEDEEARIESKLDQEISDRQSADSNLDSKITVQKERIDAILLASDADKDSFAEIVQLINSVDTDNDSAFGSYVISNNQAVDAVEARLDVAEPKISTLESEMDAVEGRLDVVEPKVSTLESEMDAVEGRLDVVEPKVSTLESEMDAVEARATALEAEDLNFVKLDGSRALTGVLKPSAQNGQDLGTGLNAFRGVLAKDHVAHFNGIEKGALHSDYFGDMGLVGKAANLAVATKNEATAGTKQIKIFTGDATTSGNTGDILIKTGIATSGIRGTVSVQAKELSLNSIKIIGLANGSGQYDAVNKGQLDAVESAMDSRVSVVESRTHKKEKFSMSNGQVSITLAHTPVAGSLMIFVDQVPMHEGASEDWTISGNVVTFINQFDSNGAKAMTSSDSVYVKYEYLA